MLRSEFNQLLENLQADLAEMGRLVDQTTRQALQALQNRDADLAQQVIDNDDVIDNLQNTLEGRVRQPAGDTAANRHRSAHRNVGCAPGG